VVSDRSFIPVVGVVGGVGSGKSAVAKWLAAERNVKIVDGDQAGHKVLADPEVKGELRARFGGGIFDSRGEVDRAALAGRVFGSASEHERSRDELERIVHPRIRRELVEQIEKIRRSNEVAAILLDAAVLFEAGWNDLCDAVVFVDAPEETRLERVKRSRGWTEDIFKAREASQRSLAWKRSASTDVIDNSRSLSESGNQLGNILDRLLEN
jgi:dephospho-CoA kinase